MASVLVVDDEDDIRELLRINLELDGHEVTVVRSGVEALDSLRTATPDVMVLDVMMPDLDGWEVLTRVKAMGGEPAQVPVLLLTARNDDLDRLRGGIEGAIHYITKPFSLVELRDEVRNALEGEPEPVKRRKAQHAALEELARMEKSEPSPPGPAQARPKVTRLGGATDTRPAPRPARFSGTQLAALSEKQQLLLDAVGSTKTVRAASESLEVSRSNVYASLRRIARKLNVGSVPELVLLARQGEFGPRPSR